MIDYKKNRIDYGEHLASPQGYNISQAIATTYSLDLYALMSIPIALFYAKNLDGEIKESRMDILDAIQKTSDVVKVYCQKGKISLPKSHNKIISFIDECICEILPENAFTSFHPKIWIIRFDKKDFPSIYRFFIMSRNLTFDRSWDLAYYSEGIVGNTTQKSNKPLLDYIKYLRTYSDFNASDRFIADLSKVKFETQFDSSFFHPIGISGYKNPLPIDCSKLLIISPFVDDKSLEKFKESCNGKRYLFSRREELNKLKPESLKGFNTYFFSDKIVDGEDFFDEGTDYEASTQNLHAKLFILENEGNYNWFLGSANCSMAALERNNEFLVQLRSNDYRCSVNTIRKTLLGTESGREYFEEYTHVSEYNSEEQNNEQQIRLFMHSLFKYLEGDNILATCIKSNEFENKYDVILSSTNIFEHNDSIFEVKFCIYGRNEYLDLSELADCKFRAINLENLSPFLQWSVKHIESKTYQEFMTKLDIQLPSGRKDAIFRSIIETKEKFFQFLQFLLGKDTEQINFLNVINNRNGQGNGGNFLWNDETPILEELLLNLSRNPEKIKDIDRIIKKLNSNIEKSPIPHDFIEFWSVFKPFISE